MSQDIRSLILVYMTVHNVMRVGVHTGECQVVGDRLAGIAVLIAARVCDLAEPGEVLTSGTVRDLIAGSGIRFEDRGLHELRGVPEAWRLYRVVP